MRAGIVSFRCKYIFLGAMVGYIFQCYRGSSIANTTSTGRCLWPSFAQEIPFGCEKPEVIWTNFKLGDISSSSEAVELSADDRNRAQMSR